MSIRIEPTDHDTFQINNKEVYQDSLGNWLCRSEFSSQEMEAWAFYKNAFLDKMNRKPIITIEY